MPIDYLRIKNFTIFKDLSTDLVSGVNVFVGQNGTGKTHLLKIVYAICELSNEKSNFSLTNYFYTNDNGYTLLNTKSDNCIEFYIDIGADILKKVIVSTIGSFQIYRKNGKINSNESKSSYVCNFHIPEGVSLNSIFIPCKDMITHSKGFLAISEKYRGFPFDKTLTDIIRKANMLPLNTPPNLALPIIPYLNKILDGEVDTQDDEFVIRKNDGRTVNFTVEAEGIKKIGLLWRLLMNESITEGSILLWDEPEANLNPEYLPVIVDCLLELSRHNVQVLVSTHNYIFAKYFDVKRQESDSVSYHALYIADGAAECETKEHFADLEHNSIGTAFDKLLDEVYNAGIGD